MGKEVYILGGGTSLENFNFNKLKGKDTIVINKSILYYPKTKYFITMDYTFLDRINRKTGNILSKTRFSKLRCKKFFVVAGDNDYIVKENGHFIDKRWNYVYRLDAFNEIIYSTKANGFGYNFYDFRHGCNSGYCAIQLAIILGYTEIYLLGFDLDIQENRTHYHKGYGESPDKFKEKLEFYYPYFERGLKQLENSGIRIYNTSPISKLKTILPYREI